MEILTEIENQIRILIRKSKKIGIVITVTTHPASKFRLLPNKHVNEFECISVLIENTEQAEKIIKKFDGKVDVFFVDIENKLKKCYDLYHSISKNIKKSQICAMKGNDFSADAAFAIILNILNSNRKRILIIGAGNIGSKLALKLVESGYKTFILNSTKSSTLNAAKAINSLKPKECENKVIPVLKNQIPLNLDCMIGFTRGTPVITKKMLNFLNKDGCILDGGLGTITDTALSYAKEKKFKCIKIDTRFGFESNATLMLNSKKLVKEIMGSKKINKEISVVAGGIIGDKGDIILDNILMPKKILGIADGRGGIIQNKKYHSKISLIQKKFKIE